ncbi:MAG TPA: flotillin family protein [Planktothrix sp.]|jgi:uncharacterized membrane protein YqiK
MSAPFDLMLLAAAGIPVLLLAFITASLFKRCPANTAMIISGFAAAGASNSFKIIVGPAGAVALPLIQQVNFISLEPHRAELKLANIYSSDGVPIAVKATLQVKIDKEPAAIAKACENFLGQRDTQITQLAIDIVEKHLIAAAAQSTASDLQVNNSQLSDKAAAASEPDLAQLGLKVVSFAVKSVEPVYQTSS